MSFATPAAHSDSLPDKVDIAIIGSGLGGLTCALKLAQRGLSVCVLERHTRPGGYAHSFERGDYLFDASLHHIGGFGEGQMTHGLLKDLGILSKIGFRPKSTLFTARLPGREVCLPNGREQVLESLFKLFPIEKEGLLGLFEELENLKRQIVSQWSSSAEADNRGRLVAGFVNKTIGDVFRDHVSDPELLALLGQIWMALGLPPELSAATFSTCVFCSFFLEGVFHIRGGGAELTRQMVARLRELGGRCVLGAHVSKICLEDGNVAGVELERGEFVGARRVVSNGNPYQTFFELLTEGEVSSLYRQRLKSMSSSLSLYTMYLGIDCPPSELGIPVDSFYFNHGLDHQEAYQTILNGDIDRTDWCLTSYEDSDAVECPDGAGILCALELTPADQWLSMGEQEYKESKLRVEKQLLEKYEGRFPGLIDHLMVKELATPRTMYRYTRNHQGAVYGLAQYPNQANSKRLTNRTPIAGLFLTGAWTWAGGGYEGAMMSGIQTASSLLKDAGESLIWKGSNVKHFGDYEIEYFRYVHPVRVYGDDMCLRGVTGPSAYLRYLDRGRVEAIEELCDMDEKNSWLRDYIVNVYKMDIRFLGDTYVGDELEVREGIRKTSSHRAAFDELIIDPSTGRVLVDALVEVAFLDNNRKLAEVPSNIEEFPGIGSARVMAPSPPIPFSNDDHYIFENPFRVYYEDTDEQRITYHVSYTRYITRTIFDFFSSRIEKESTHNWISERAARVGRLEIRYLKSCGLGDQIVVRCGARINKEGRFVLDHRIVNTTTGQVLADAVATMNFGSPDDETEEIPSLLKELVISS